MRGQENSDNRDGFRLYRRVLIAVSLVLVLLLVLSTDAQGRTWVVDDDSGSWADFQLIQDAIDNSTGGDDVRIFEGIYYESVLVDKNDISILGNASDICIVNGTSGETVLDIQGDSIGIENISVFGGGEDGSGNATIPSVYVDHAQYVNLTNVSVKDGEYFGIYVENSEDVIIHDCTIQFILDRAVYIVNSNAVTVSNTSVRDNYDLGICARYSDDLTVSGCLVANNTYDGIQSRFSDIGLISDNHVEDSSGGINIGSETTRFIIRSNVVMNGSHSGIHFWEVSDSLIEDNYIFNCSSGISPRQSVNITVRDNICYGNRFLGIQVYNPLDYHIINNTCVDSGEDGLRIIGIGDEVDVFQNTITTSAVNGIGIYAQIKNDDSELRNLVIWNNTIANNDNLGIELWGEIEDEEMSRAWGVIYENSIINNTNQAVDDGHNITWYYHRHGNYWSDYNGNDSDEDGVGDKPYHIDGDGNRSDKYPLMRPMNGSIPDIDPSRDPRKWIVDADNGSWADFTRIQDAIDNSWTGDIIYVYEGTYGESVILEKDQLTVRGNGTGTIINGAVNESALKVRSNGASVFNLTIMGGGGWTENGPVSSLLVKHSTQIRLENVTITNSGQYGLTVDKSEVVTVFNCVIQDSYHRGIGLFDSEDVSISYSSILNNGHHGINSEGVDELTINECTIINNTQKGIAIRESWMSEINANYIEGNGGGVRIQWSSNCTVLKNIILNCTDSVSGIISGGNDSLIGSNYLENCFVGIYVGESSGSTVVDNICAGNSWIGIDVYKPDDLEIVNNTCENNEYGLRVTGFGDELHIHHNTFSNNSNIGIGIYANMIGAGRDITDVIINNNTIQNNSKIGIELWGRVKDQNESNTYGIIYQNALIDNTENAQDDGNNVTWHHGKRGNYWSDYNGTDVNNDGIGDIPYVINGSLLIADLFPLMNPNGSGSNDMIPQTWIVDDDNGSWADFSLIQDALEHATDFDIINIYAGEYEESIIIEKRLDIIGNGSSNTTLEAGSDEEMSVVWVKSNNVMIEGLGIEEGTKYRPRNGILVDSDQCSLLNIHLSDIERGIALEDGAKGNLIESCSFSDSRRSIHIAWSDDNRIIHNRVVDAEYGLGIWHSNRTVVSNNTFSNCGINIYGHYKANWNTHSIDQSNQIDGSPIIYVKNASGGVVNGTSRHIIMAACEYVIVEGNLVNHSGIGIQMGFCRNNIVRENTVSNQSYSGISLIYSDDNLLMNNSIETCEWGIYLHRSKGNRIVDNEIRSSETGVRLLYSEDTNISSNRFRGNSDTYSSIVIDYSSLDTMVWANEFTLGDELALYITKTCINSTIHHNNFYIHNEDRHQVTNVGIATTWDDGSEGNYWSDYTGKDNDKDGIGDVPYYIHNGTGTIDSYPLMDPYSPPEKWLNRSLEVTADISYDGYVVTGESLNVTITLGYHSGIPHESNLTVRLNTKREDAVVKNSSQVLILSPGTSYTNLTFSVSLNESGDYTFEVVVLHEDQMVGSEQTTVTASGADYSFSLGLNRLTSGADPGDKVKYDLTVENQGNVPQMIRLTVDSEWVTITNQSLYILPGSEKEARISALVPLNASGSVSFNITATSYSDDNEKLNSGTARGTISLDDIGDSTDPVFVTWIFVGASIGLLGAGFAGLWAIDRGRYFAIPLLFPLYSKLKKEAITDHETRGRIVLYLNENPGSHFNRIKKELDLKNGTTGYHLRVLESGGFIKSRPDGMYRRFYPYGYRVPDVVLSDVEKRVVMQIIKQPGIKQRELASRLDITQSTVAYHVKDLKAKGVVSSERKWGCHITDEYKDVLRTGKKARKPRRKGPA